MDIQILMCIDKTKIMDIKIDIDIDIYTIYVLFKADHGMDHYYDY